MTSMHQIRTALLLLFACLRCLDAACTAESFGVIRRFDPRLDKIVPRGAKLEKLASGFDWSEGPVWDKRAGWLLFSDVPRNVVLRWRPGKGIDTFLNSSGYSGTQKLTGEPGSNGLAIDREGRLILCQHGDHRVARREGNGSFTTLVDRYQGKRLNSPNDLVFSSKGEIYFTDPPYGLKGLNDDPLKELPFNGVYRLSPDGKLTLLTKDVTFPNGIAFSPNEKTLYVAQSDPDSALWYAFDVKADGTLGRSRVLYDATKAAKEGKKGLPDGIKVDQRGNLFATGPGGVYVFTPSGELLGIIDPGEANGNCAWGGDGSMLYITSDMNLCRILTSTHGLGF